MEHATESPVDAASGTRAEPPLQPTGCCPPFDPEPFRDRELTWREELFAKEHVRCFMHVPLDFGSRVKKLQARIDAAGATPEQPLMLSDDRSPWRADLYVRVTKPVSGAEMTTLSGNFLTRVYEGPYSNAPRWMEDMRAFAAQRGKPIERLYLGYTTCPACAKAYGKNYVVLFARVA